MELELTTFLIVCPLVFLGGLIDAIAGGGGLISLPAYMIAGVPAHYALGTNKLSSIVGTMVASYRYYRHRLVDIWLVIPSIMAALLGSSFGASLSLLMNEQVLQRLLLIILPIVAFYVFKRKNFDCGIDTLPRARVVAYAIVISFIVGGYDGFYGPGTGTFLILLYTGIMKMDVRIASGNAKFVNLASNMAALAVFLYNGKVILLLGACAGVFGILGGYIGAGLVINKGSNIVRPVILVVLALLFVKIVYNTVTGEL